MSKFLKEVVKLSKEKRDIDAIIGKIKYEIKASAVAGVGSVLYEASGFSEDTILNIHRVFVSQGFCVKEVGSGILISWEHKLQSKKAIIIVKC